MAELEIRGSKKYIKRLSEHLKVEHPSTRKRMRVEGVNKKRMVKRK